MKTLEAESTKIVPPLTKMKEQKYISSELFSVYLDNSKESKGEIHWGFSDQTKYTGSISWHPFAPEKTGKQEGKYVYYKVGLSIVCIAITANSVWYGAR